MLQNKQSHKYLLCSVMSQVVSFAYHIMLNISTGRVLQKFYQRSNIVNLNAFYNAVKKILDKISCHRHLGTKIIIEMCV